MQIGPLLVVAVLFLVMVALSLATLALLPLWGLVDASRQPRDRWAKVERRRRRWLIAQLLLGPLATIAYARWVRPALNHADEWEVRPTSVQPQPPVPASSSRHMPG